ncbi:hypothetical protein ACOSQ2_019939 [Xanthoceras sorbifolium]
MGVGSFLEKFGKKKRQEKARTSDNESSRARTDKGKGVLVESSRRRQSSPPRNTRKGVVIKDTKEQYSSDSDSDLHDTSEPSPQHNPQPSNYPPSGYGYPTPSYPYPSVHSHWNYHPDKAEIPENEKWMFSAADSIFKWP